MKKLMYLSIAILCLSISTLIGFHIGSQKVQAEAKGPIFSDNGIITHFAEWMLDENGHAWFIGSTWERTSPDVPAWLLSELKFWHLTVVITQDNSAWKWNGSEWINVGPWPDSPVPANQTNWGQIKGEYKGK